MSTVDAYHIKKSIEYTMWSLTNLSLFTWVFEKYVEVRVFIGFNEKVIIAAMQIWRCCIRKSDF